jgi:hypothetical protein
MFLWWIRIHFSYFFCHFFSWWFLVLAYNIYLFLLYILSFNKCHESHFITIFKNTHNFHTVYECGSTENSKNEKARRSMKSYLPGRITVLVGHFAVAGISDHVVVCFLCLTILSKAWIKMFSFHFFLVSFEPSFSYFCKLKCAFIWQIPCETETCNQIPKKDATSKNLRCSEIILLLRHLISHQNLRLLMLD